MQFIGPFIRGVGVGGKQATVTVKVEKISSELTRLQPTRFIAAFEMTRVDAPVDRVEVVEWMQKCGTINRILSPWYNDYSRAGGDLEAQSNDSWYPGVFTSSYQVFLRQTGNAVAVDGYVRVDNRYGALIARARPFERYFFDGLRGLVVETDLYRVQHNTLLAEIKSFAKLPFSGDMRLGAIDVARVGYLSLPAIFRTAYPPIPTPRAVFYASYEAVLPGRLIVQVYSATGEFLSESITDSDAGRMRAVITVDGWITGDVKIVFAFDGSEAGMNLYEVYSIFPPSIPL